MWVLKHPFCKSNYYKVYNSMRFRDKNSSKLTGSNQRKMHLVAITITKQNMNKELVVIKYGGGLITYKDQLCEANHAHINGLSEVVIIPIWLWSFYRKSKRIYSKYS